MSTTLPSPATTLAILLGASEWPLALTFDSSPAFSNSANRFREYLTSPDLFGLPKENLLDLFDSNGSPDEIDTAIHNFLEARCSKSESSTTPTDVVVIFIGHGGFDRFSDFFLAIRRTRSANLKTSSIDIRALSETVKQQARRLRRYIILDCCFAGSANSAFQSSLMQTAVTQTYSAFAESGKGVGLPGRGTSLLCSSRHDKPSLLTPDNRYTMFSDALLHALEHGNPKQRNDLDLRTIKGLAEEYLAKNYGQDAPKPEVHSPDQTEGDVATVPIFPNAARRLKKVDDQEQGLESADHLHRMFSLAATLDPSGFTKVLDYLNNNEHIKRTKERISDEPGTVDLYKEGLVALAQYYPAPPPHSSHDFGFRMYKELLERNLRDERYAGYAAVRLLQLRVLEITSKEFANLFLYSNNAASAIFGYLLDLAEKPAHRKWVEEKLGDILVICAKADRLDNFSALAARHKAHFNPEGDYQIFYPTLTLENGMVLEIYLDLQKVKETALKYYVTYRSDKIRRLVSDPKDQERLGKYVSAYITAQIGKPESLSGLLQELKRSDAKITFSKNDVVLVVQGQNFIKHITIELEPKVQAEFLKWYFTTPYYNETINNFLFPTSFRAH